MSSMDHIRAMRELTKLVNQVLDYTAEDFEAEMSRIIYGATGTTFTSLKDENDQLKVHIEKARRLYVRLTNNVEFADNGAGCYVADGDLMADFDAWDENTPAMSLADVEASAITYALCMVYHEEDDHRGYYSYEGLKLHADHIRQQALENKS